MRKTAKAMALLTAASMIMTAFTPVYAESTDDTAAVDWENGDNIKAIKEKGVITVATGTYVPFEYRDDDNNIVGFDIDLAQYIADKLGVDMEVTDMEFQSIVPSIQNGEYDFSIAAMYKTDERCEVVDMSKSYCDSGMILAVKEDSEYADTIKSLADCDGLKVAVKEGATSYNVAQSFLDENPDVSYEIVQYKDTVGCVSDLLACGDCGGTTKERYLEILEFTHFVEFFSFNKIGENHKEKILVQRVTVVVALDLGTGNTKNLEYENE